MGAATFGASIGGMILVPLNAMLLERWGALAGGVTLAAIAISLVVPLAIWVVKDGPEAVGQREDGEAGDEGRGSRGRPLTRPSTPHPPRSSIASGRLPRPRGRSRSGPSPPAST